MTYFQLNLEGVTYFQTGRSLRSDRCSHSCDSQWSSGTRSSLPECSHMLNYTLRCTRPADLLVAHDHIPQGELIIHLAINYMSHSWTCSHSHSFHWLQSFKAEIMKDFRTWKRAWKRAPLVGKVNEGFSMLETISTLALALLMRRIGIHPIHEFVL